jgi:hypothetical protein
MSKKPAGSRLHDAENQTKMRQTNGRKTTAIEIQGGGRKSDTLCYTMDFG